MLERNPVYSLRLLHDSYISWFYCDQNTLNSSSLIVFLIPSINVNFWILLHFRFPFWRICLSSHRKVQAQEVKWSLLIFLVSSSFAFHFFPSLHDLVLIGGLTLKLLNPYVIQLVFNMTWRWLLKILVLWWLLECHCAVYPVFFYHIVQ